jgi:hypothetical protein
MHTVANDIISRVEYNTVHKNDTKPISVEKYKSNPNFAFLGVCHHAGELALPLLQ